MIGIDTSLVPAVLIFLSVVLALNYVLLRPLSRVLGERAARTTGVVQAARKDVNHSIELFGQYQAAVKAARVEGYRLMEVARAGALKKRADGLAEARAQAKQMVKESQVAIQKQAVESKSHLAHDVDEIAQAIAASILGRPA
jgi:F-type H+-transporting ATPase subunit b